jgi:hypothetical protein
MKNFNEFISESTNNTKFKLSEKIENRFKQYISLYKLFKESSVDDYCVEAIENVLKMSQIQRKEMYDSLSTNHTNTELDLAIFIVLEYFSKIK